MKITITCVILILPALFLGCYGDGLQFSGEIPEQGLLFPDPVVECVDIVGLTEITRIDEFASESVIKAYIDLKDSSGKKMFGRGVFRFELYEYLSRCADSKGRRIFIWPDINAETFEKSVEYWHENFKSYEFELKMDQALSVSYSYVLLVTFSTNDGRRLCDEQVISYEGSFK